MKTKLEILKETKDFYSEDVSRRAIGINGCVYLTEDGRKCAYSRCVDENSGFVYSLMGGIGLINDVEKYLKKEYQGHERAFWRSIQVFHDHPAHWNVNGLTKQGINFYNKLVEQFK